MRTRENSGVASDITKEKLADHPTFEQYPLKWCFSYFIFLQYSAHERHISAHLLQWSTSCRSHSSAHASQTSAHIMQNCFANRLSIDINEAEVQQTAAHSLLIWTQLAIILTSVSPRSDVAQNSHAPAHRMQASMQSCHLVFWSLLKLLLAMCCYGEHHINNYLTGLSKL